MNEPLHDLRSVAARLAQSMPCNCDFDNWEPERTTGHSCVCRIHKAAWKQYCNIPLREVRR